MQKFRNLDAWMQNNIGGALIIFLAVLIGILFVSVATLFFLVSLL